MGLCVGTVGRDPLGVHVARSAFMRRFPVPASRGPLCNSPESQSSRRSLDQKSRLDIFAVPAPERGPVPLARGAGRPLNVRSPLDMRPAMFVPAPREPPIAGPRSGAEDARKSPECWSFSSGLPSAGEAGGRGRAPHLEGLGLVAGGAPPLCHSVGRDICPRKGGRGDCYAAYQLSM